MLSYSYSTVHVVEREDESWNTLHGMAWHRLLEALGDRSTGVDGKKHSTDLHTTSTSVECVWRASMGLMKHTQS